ncbi:MAG: hypothetical protein LW878_10680 [Proteobacteria bacterium]|nr:hypothetical protein [Pseudomonadota bacterium]
MITSKRKKSETSKSARLFKLSFIACLLMGQAYAAKVSDRYLYRIETMVVGAHDLEVAHKDLKSLFCRFPDSLLREWISDSYLKKLSETATQLKTLKTPLEKENNLVIFLASTRQLFKLLNYLSTQEVNLDPALVKAVSSAPGCPAVNWREDPLSRSFERWLRLEVYLRSRYAPSGIQANGDWRKRRVESVLQFVDSLDKQVAHENFW